MSTETLITVKKGNETMDVHPTALQQHKDLGWTVLAEASKATDPGRESEELPTEDSLSKKTKAELVAIAAEQGVDIVPDELTKHQIIEKILGN
jgi:hypothetical protein